MNKSKNKPLLLALVIICFLVFGLLAVMFLPVIPVEYRYGTITERHMTKNEYLENNCLLAGYPGCYPYIKIKEDIKKGVKFVTFSQLACKPEKFSRDDGSCHDEIKTVIEKGKE